ncbi:hypothetical protein [Massilia consociata]|uniref:Uncharacterized protein n=1 Tax=Massilia consociata TaxID=760117 RepID=A0ABV6FLZ9_9BURK
MNVRDAMARTVEWEFSQSNYAAVLEDVPPTLFRYWAEVSQGEFPGIPRDASFFAQSVEGLMMFFDCVSAAGRQPCGLPSRAADSVWHAWMRMDAPNLERFCIRHFGRSIPHVEKTHMRGHMRMALSVCLVQARRRASKPVAGPNLPRLFLLDGQLGMPRGFGYRIIGSLVAWSVLDEFGNSDDHVSFPDNMTPRGLLQAGLVSKAEYDEGIRLGGRGDLRLAGAGNGAPDTADGDAGGGDGAAPCSGGSACGGGCGGGGCGS